MSFSEMNVMLYMFVQLKRKYENSLDTVEVNDRISQRHHLIKSAQFVLKLKCKCYGKSIFEVIAILLILHLHAQ